MVCNRACLAGASGFSALRPLQSLGQQQCAISTSAAGTRSLVRPMLGFCLAWTVWVLTSGHDALHVDLLQAVQPQAQPPALLMVDVMAATGIEDLLGRGTAGVAPHELLCSLQWADSSSEDGAGEGCSAPYA